MYQVPLYDKAPKAVETYKFVFNKEHDVLLYSAIIYNNIIL